MKFLQNKWLRLVCLVLIAAFISRAAYLYYYKKIDGFRVKSIFSDLAYHPEWDTGALGEEESADIKKILDQPFYYLGKGGQAYAFQSGDQEWVIKFFKKPSIRYWPLYEILSVTPFFEDCKVNEEQRKYRKLFDCFHGYKWGYALNKEGGGLVYVHLNPTFHQFQKLTLYDKLGMKHHVDLDQVVFILQKKGVLLKTILKDDFSRGNLKGAKSRIQAILSMYLDNYKKGLYDRDYGVIHNTGFISGKAAHIDLGKITYDPRMADRDYFQEDLAKVTHRIKEWIEKEFPELLPELSKELGRVVN
jgi:hypothetical protein